MNNKNNEKRNAKINEDFRGGRDVIENAAMRTTTSPSQSTEQHAVPVLERGSQQGRGVTRRCFPFPTVILPGAEAVRGPEYNEEDEEGTVIIGEGESSDEIVTARVVNVDTEEDRRSQVESLQGQLRRNETAGSISVQTLDQPPNSLLPESPPLYGRKEQLKKLGEVLCTGGRMAALVGGAGMGKTHCASHFARQWLREDAARRFVLWLESDTENVVRVYLKALENSLGGEVPDSEEEMSIRDLAHLVWQALGIASTQFEWLVVYNNVPEVLGDSEGPEAFSPLFFPTPGLGAWTNPSHNKEYLLWWTH